MQMIVEQRSVFGAYVREHRLRHGWNQRDFAKQVPMDHTYVYKIEAGRMNPPSDRLIARLAEVLEVPVEELMYRSRKVPTRLRRLLYEQPLLADLVYMLSVQALPEHAYQELLAVVKRYE